MMPFEECLVHNPSQKHMSAVESFCVFSISRALGLCISDPFCVSHGKPVEVDFAKRPQNNCIKPAESYFHGRYFLEGLMDFKTRRLGETNPFLVAAFFGDAAVLSFLGDDRFLGDDFTFLRSRVRPHFPASRSDRTIALNHIMVSWENSTQRSGVLMP
jgi:hypothetical protein